MGPNSNGGSGGTAPGSGGALGVAGGSGANGGSGTNGGSGGGGPLAGPDPDCVKMVAAAKSFIDGLDAPLKAELAFTWDGPQRRKFEFLPPGNVAREGLTLKKLSPLQVTAFEAFLRSAMSNPGYLKVDAIRQLELVIRAQENADPNFRDPENYFISFFGDPSAESATPWGWRLEGHHLSVHSSVIACQQFTATPAFWGASGFGGQNPNPLLDGEQAAKTLFDSLTGDAKTAASTGPEGDAGIATKQAKLSPYEPAGVVGAQLLPEQQAQLRLIINAFVGNMSKPVAESRLKAIEDAGIGEVRFLYKGGYFRLQGPTFLIEHAPQTANHIHSIWRDFDGDWGEDLLQRHLDNMHNAP